MSNLLQRIITALIGVGIIITGIVLSQLAFALIFMAIMVLTLREFYGLAKDSGSQPFQYWGIFFSICLFGLTYAVLTGNIEARWLWLLPPLLLFCFLFPLYRLETVHPINCLAVTLLGIIYIAIPFTCLLVVAFHEGAYDYGIIVGLLFAQWSNDTGGYIAGRTLGKTKLFEKVSPKKTWEGTIGGAVLTFGMLYLGSLYFDSLTLWQWMGLALIVIVFGSFGDLVESLFKRTLAIKDSGSSIPGHGGFLDRFDGLVLALPFVTAYVILISG